MILWLAWVQIPTRAHCWLVLGEMEMKTHKEIEEEIRKLWELEPRIRPFSAFGGDNCAKIRAGIKVLEQDLSEDDIYELEGIVDDDTLSIMLDVRYWLDGETDDLPSAGWIPLIQK